MLWQRFTSSTTYITPNVHHVSSIHGQSLKHQSLKMLSLDVPLGILPPLVGTNKATANQEHWKLGSMVSKKAISPIYKWIYWGKNPLTNHLPNSWDIQVLLPVLPQKNPEMRRKIICEPNLQLFGVPSVTFRQVHDGKTAKSKRSMMMHGRCQAFEPFGPSYRNLHQKTMEVWTVQTKNKKKQHLYSMPI